MLKPGAIIAIPDPRINPRNRRKWHICVCSSQRLFLRINSKPLWPPWHHIAADGNAFLEHDSYVELQSLSFFSESELRQARMVGQMSADEARKLAVVAQTADTLAPDRQELIWERLGSLSD